MARGVLLGRVAGVRVRVSHGLVVLTAALAAGMVGAGAATAPMVAAVAAVAVIVVSMLVHELAHAVVARAHGFAVDGVHLSLLGGEARYTGHAPPPHVELQVAAAGPLAALACLLVGAAAVFPGAERALVLAAWLNALEAVVNLAPLPTLDGGRIVSALRRRRVPARAAVPSAG